MQELQSAQPGARPGENEIRAELARILGSRSFADAAQSSRFLRFVVEESLAGRADELKARTIATHVFETPRNFAAQIDPLARIEAIRVQRRLTEYYLGEGRDDSIRIGLPLAGYVPRFEYAGAGQQAAAVVPLAASVRAVPLIALGSVAVLTIALIIWYSFLVSSSLPGSLPGGTPPRVFISTLTALSEDRDLSFFAEGLTEEIITALVDFNIVGVAGTPTGVQDSGDGAVDFPQVDAEYALSGSIRSVENTVRVSVRVMDMRNGAQLWTTAFDEDIARFTEISIQERVALEIAMLIASPYGPIFANEMQIYADKPVELLNSYECLIRFYQYAVSFDPGLHQQSRTCLLRVMQTDPEFAAGWSSLAVVYLHEHFFAFNPLPDAGDALERATEAVRTSLDIEGSGRVAAIALMAIRYASGDQAGFEQATARALSIQPPHPAILLQIGFIRTLSGDWQTGIPLLDDAIPLTANVPGWVYAAYAFRYLMTEQYDEALTWALRTDAPEWFISALATAASAALAGRQDIAEREARRLLRLYPEFEETGRAQLAKWRPNEDLMTVLLDGIERAGVRVL